MIYIRRIIFAMACLLVGLVIMYIIWGSFISWGEWDISEWTSRRRFLYLWWSAVLGALIARIFYVKRADQYGLN